MKIINIIENLDDTYGGPAKSVPYMCKYLNDIDVETEMLSIQYNENEVNSLVEKYNLKWKSFQYDLIKKIRYSKDLKNYLESFLKRDEELILHTHNSWNYIPYIAYKMSVRHNAPLIMAIRSSLYEWSLQQNKLQKQIALVLFQKSALKHATCIHITEPKELDAVRNLGIKTPVALVPNGVEFDEFKNLKNKIDSKKSLKLDVDKKYILFISRLHPKKGLEYLVNAWIKLAQVHTQWDLLIVGPEYDKQYIEEIKVNIRNHDLEDRVVFKGMLKDQNRVDAFGASDLFVLPSHTENFGIAIAEAMVAKLPIITTHGTPWQEIEEKDAGWWVKLNQENIDNALEKALFCSDDELKQKGLNGHELIQKYEWKYQAKKMKQVYEWVLGYAKKPTFVYEFGEEI